MDEVEKLEEKIDMLKETISGLRDDLKAAEYDRERFKSMLESIYEDIRGLRL